VILVDSSVWIDFFNGRRTRQTDLLDGLLGEEEILTGDLIYVEVLQGFRRDREFQRAKRALDTLPLADLLGREVALATAINYRALRRRAITVRGTIDLIIATFCVQNGHVLLHADRDFEPMREHLGLLTL
jgi:predicted nucleic acid-binding protein